MPESKRTLTELTSMPLRPWRAAGLSCAVHILLLVLIATLMWTNSTDRAGEERPRRVALILAETSTEPGSDAEYLEPTPDRQPPAAGLPEDPLPGEPVRWPAEPANDAAPAMPASSPDPLPESASSMTGGVRGDQPGQDLSAATLEAIAAEQRELANRPPPAPPATISIFGSAPMKGRKFVFVLDRSSSMGASGLDVLSSAQTELVRALAPLAPENEFQIVAYHQQTVTLKARQLLPASEENKSEVNGFIQHLVPFGSTDHEAGLYRALELEPDVIILLTDGDTPELNAGQIQAITRVSRGRAAIHCIQFGLTPGEPPGSFMQKLAAKTGGSYRYVDVNRLREKKR